MKKSKILSLVMMPVVIASIVACGGKEKRGNALDTLIEMFDAPVAFKCDLTGKVTFDIGTENEWSMNGADLALERCYSKDAVYTFADQRAYGYTDESILYKSATTGNIARAELNPFSNTVEEYDEYYFKQETFEPYTRNYDETYFNVFKKYKDNFTVNGDKITLYDADGLDSKPFIIMFGDEKIQMDVLEEFEITVGKDGKPTTFTMMFDCPSQLTDYNTEIIVNVEGEFVDPSKYNIAYPTPVPEQPGQEKLDAKIKEINAAKNYTIEYDIEDKGNKYKAKLELSSGGYLVSYDEAGKALGNVDKGSIYLSDNEGVKFESGEDGVYVAKSFPKSTYSFEETLGYGFKLSGQVFDVNSDGSYSLHPSIDANYAFSVARDDELIGFVTVDDGTYKIAIDDSGTMSYSYTAEEGTLKVSAKITKVGSTTMSITSDALTPYKRKASWTEAIYDSGDSYLNTETLELCLYALIGEGEDYDDIPYVETSQGSLLQYSNYQWDPNYGTDLEGTEVINIGDVVAFNGWCKDVDEANLCLSIIEEQVTSNPRYRYEAPGGTSLNELPRYVYTNSKGVEMFYVEMEVTESENWRTGEMLPTVVMSAVSIYTPEGFERFM
ncbi:MAG: hypothetical protein MJ241_04200 [Bacilli bacterium]|nr:hypothetical protein [Bacilli bacterium]